jgi:pimeloyl-ACP methyl ester carboxylesterase
MPDSDRSARRSHLKKVVRLAVFGLLSFAVLLYAGLIVAFVHFATRPAHSTLCCVTPADWGFTYQDVRFTGGDGLTLAAWYIPSQNGAAIILLHGYGGNRLMMVDHARYLAEAGYGVLMVDLRAHGESEGEQRSWGWQDVRDIPGAVAYLHSRPEVQHIGILGHSIGGQVALRAAADLADIEAVVADGPSLATAADIWAAEHTVTAAFWYVTYSLSDRVLSRYVDEPIPTAVIDIMPRLAGRPLFVIAAGSDPDEVPRARAYLAAVQSPKTLWVIPEASHGQTWRVRPEEYAQRVIAFFDAALLE